MKTRQRTLFILLGWSIAFLASQSNVSADYWLKFYEAKTYEDADGQTLSYRFLKPDKVEPGKKYPLVLFLHGAGERGTDNTAQLRPGIRHFTRSFNREKHPCFVVAPQCPPNTNWTHGGRSSPQPGAPLTLAFEVLDKLAAELPVDKDRIYVTGLSMGGFGTWNAIAQRPVYFAAAIPICGGGDKTQATKLKDLPIWAFHGDKDKTVPCRLTVEMVEAIQQAGGKAKMTIYPGVDHDSWSRTYADPAVLDWLFAQKKS